MSIATFRILSVCLAVLSAASALGGPAVGLGLGLSTGLAAVFALGLCGVALFFAAGVASALQANAEAARRICAGDFTATLDAAPDGPLGASQEAVAAMLAYLKRELGFSRAIVKSIVTPLVVTDLDEVFIHGNQGLVEMLQHDGRPEQFYGQNVAVFFYGEKRDTVLGVAMREKKAISKEVEFTGRKGGKRNIHIDASPL